MKKYALLGMNERNIVLMERSCVENEWNSLGTLRSVNQARNILKILNDATDRPNSKTKSD